MAHEIAESATASRGGTAPARHGGWVRRWLLVAFAAALVAGTATLAYRAVETRVGSSTGATDGSSLFAEAQRMEGLAASPVRFDGSAEFAEELRMRRFSPPRSADHSSQLAEYRRQLGLASSRAGDGSSEAAEYRRQLVLAGSAVDDGSWEVAESRVMTQLAPRGWPETPPTLQSPLCTSGGRSETGASRNPARPIPRFGPNQEMPGSRSVTPPSGRRGKLGV